MKLTWKLCSVVILIGVFSFSCSKAKTEPTFVFKQSEGSNLAAKAGSVTISMEELTTGIESELYEIDMKKFDTKFNRVQELLLKKLMNKDPRKKGLSNDEFLDKYIASKIKISQKQIDAFIKEKKIPAQHVNDDLKKKVVDYLKEGEKQKAIKSWIGEQVKGEEITVFFKKPKRPIFNVTAGSSPFMGGKDAKVTVIEYSDFQCPFCSKATETIQGLKKKYGNKIKVVFKQFPLSFHNQAKDAAIASLCANAQGVNYFWKMHDAMFADQSKLSIANLKETAKKLGVDTKKFNTCLDKKEFKAAVEADMAQGAKNGVKSTPTFFVNGKLISGAQPLEVFSEVIDEELKM